MKFCNFCAKKNENVKNINVNKITINKSTVKIKSLLNIFQSDVIKYLLDGKNNLICNNCLKQLIDCYEFVQQIKKSEILFYHGNDIKTEHDYVETTTRNIVEYETDVRKVTVDENAFNNGHVNNYEFNSNFKFKHILPKTTDKNVKCEKILKHIDSKTRIYKCLRCADSFKSFKQLKAHEQELCEHKSIKDFQICQYCHKCFVKEASFNAHVALKHPKKELTCCLCKDKIFAGKGYLLRHIEKMHGHGSLTYFCGVCEDLVVLTSLEELRSHFMAEHEATSLSAEDQTQTDLNDDDMMDLEMHEEFLDEFLLAHTNENSFQFSECWEALDLHLPDMLHGTNNVSEFVDAFSCPKCFEHFKNPQPLLKHLAEIHDLPVLICRICSKAFASFRNFKTHKLQKCLKNSTLDALTLECPYCSKTFKNSINLKQHLRIVHSQVKRHICQLCDKQFSTLDHLKKHVLSQHQNERKHVCMVCDKSFTQLGHLKQHLAIHTTGKTIQCEECPLKFWRKIDLKKHRMNKHVPIECTSK